MPSHGPVMLDLAGAFMGPERKDLLTRHERYAASLARLSGQESVTLRVILPQRFRGHQGLGRVTSHVELTAGLPQLHPRFLFSAARRTGLEFTPSMWVASDPFSSGPMQLVGARRTGRPLQVQAHGDFGLGALDRNWAWASAKRILAQRLLLAADNVRTVSHEQARTLTSRFSLDPERVFVAPVPIHEAYLKTPLGAEERPLRILFAGRIHPERGLTLWAQTAHLIAHREPRAVFDIVGAGPHEPELRSLLQALPRVTWHGWLPASRVATLMLQSKVLLSTPHFESYGRSLTEALCMGLHVVATDTTGARRLSQSASARVAWNADDLAELAVEGLSLPVDPDKTERARREQEIRDEEAVVTVARSWMS